LNLGIPYFAGAQFAAGMVALSPQFEQALPVLEDSNKYPH